MYLTHNGYEDDDMFMSVYIDGVDGVLSYMRVEDVQADIDVLLEAKALLEQAKRA